MIHFYPEGEGLAWQVYEEVVFEHTIVTFRYLQISLPLLDPEEYLGTGNVLAAALASVMGRRRRGAPRARLHGACLRRLLDAEAAGEVDAATADLLADVVETYLPVSAADREALRVQLEREGGDTMATDIDTTQLTWRSRVSLEVYQEVKRADIRRAVQVRFGRVSPEMEAAIAAADTEDALDGLFDRALTAAAEADLLGRQR